jgi:hypothetical protein
VSARPDPLLLVVDASVDNRIASELRLRRRESIALSQLGIHRMEDPDVLSELCVRLPDMRWALVTADDSMPDDWSEVIRWLNPSPTIATIRPHRSSEHDDDQWARDVIHRWAHVMQVQAPESIRRYWLSGHGVWRPVRRPRRRTPGTG